MKKIRVYSILLVLVMVLSLFAGCSNDVMVDTTKNKYTYDEAVSNVNKLYDRVSYKTIDDPSIYDNVTSEFYIPESDTSTLLPDFQTGRQAVVNENINDQVTAIICSSTEKATNNATDRWLIDVANAYNKKADRKGSIRLYGVASGEMFDYIRSGKFVPDAFTPSNKLWGDALSLTPAYDRLAGNVAGIVSKDGKDIKQVIGDVEAGTIKFGYTNPLASSTGANFLLDYIYNYNGSSKFKDFQSKIALVSYTTLQMKTAALSGKLDAFIYEAQQFSTGEIQGNKTLANLYKFVPFGVRHDNPYYILNKSKSELLEDFAKFCLSTENQALASKYGFNQYDDYKGESISGSNLLADQTNYKENKSGGRPIVSIFVSDCSGSMEGSPIEELKSSLKSCAGVISESNYVGLVTFASDVKVNLPVAKFDETTQSRFIVAASEMIPRGGTAMYSALVVASKEIADFKEKNPNVNAIYRIFVLTDGENTEGLSKGATLDTLKSLGVPIYCIGYNGGNSDLDTIASLNEAASIKITEQNVGYALANFFKAEF